MRLSRRTRLAGVGLVAAVSLTLAACGGSDSGEATDQIITVWGAEPQNPLVPTATNETGGGNVIQNLWTGLVEYEKDGSSVNGVADSIESDDFVTWTVKLKADQKFTNDEPVTAESFVKAWNYGATASNEQLNSYFFYPIAGTTADGTIDGDGTEISGLKVVDDSTFTIKLKQPEADFPSRLGYSAFYPLPEAAYGSDGKITKEFGENPIGNGPYKMAGADAWKHNTEIALVPNEGYDGIHKAQNGGLTFKIYQNLDSAYSDVQSGVLDVLETVPDSALTTFQTDSNVQAISKPGSVFQSFTIPESLEHFKADEEGALRRQAISLAINREQVTDKIFNDTRTPAVDFTAPVMPGFTKDVPGNEVLEFNADKAKELWAEADEISEWDGTFQIAYNADGGHKAWVDATTNLIKNNLGIDASGKPYPTFKELRDDITNRTIKTAFRTGWQPDYPSIYNYLASLYATGAGSNDGDYSSEEFDKLISESATIEDEDKRYEVYNEAQAVLMKDLPAIPLWYANVAGAAATGVSNVDFTWQNIPDYSAITK